ncbi:potassium transporter KefB [Spirosoma aureum]|uniref:Potassium transporter KefB n=1 Tax=Spirosoma aureum TaxID=2692134 RepID=A0A6G9AMV8_9BACT|nr:potassium transporter KefB [Spirosoma aureum]QIP13811.1 potassium transporter KefB [Spirosoma aureum]
MTQRTNLTTPSIHPDSVEKRMVQGAGIALILIALFLLPVREPDPAWGKLWMIKPLLIVPVAGAIGGIIYHLLDHLRYQGGWKKALAYLLSLIGYIIAVWMGTVLGLAGTLWD